MEDNNLLRVRKGGWTREEDELLRQYIQQHGEGKWHQVPLKAATHSPKPMASGYFKLTAGPLNRPPFSIN
ncbi:hypothetical protein ACE6H2_020619 [Prunus campanulata]